ncbi:ABC transporter permease [Clostridium botulinum]|uniref:ABC transporter permease n=1 Tax=Clostridium botulinum TaxID=1491 RepID=UPI000AD9871B|nr:ABC transporter permease [Clostridium botulinum]MBY7002874.1 ABC transporter permease [Clostridium botulinum]MCR1146671.1 ABC transporter permease [Clostridium botulinum]NFH92458.1 ABC transporter permease [Clostridium botulinum]NFH95749.1 ABC transporter permease [Clostridium botulinum]NFI23873.1 ABC transporter permease [Clostridium botulinum]
MLNILWRNVKWRIKNPLAIIIPVLQPLIWLVLYSVIGNQALQDTGIGNYTAFILPGLVVLVTFGACSSSGMINLVMKSNGSFFRILIAPISRSSIVLGQILEGVLISFVEVIILFIVSTFFSVRISSDIGGIILIILLIFLTAFFMSGLANCISLILPNQVIYETIMTAIVLPVFFLSSALFPVENLSNGLKVAVMINPFTHIINALRSLMLGNTVVFWRIFPVILLFTVMCICSFLLAKWRLKKETTH